jgi:radical SAM superfamily enzyme YgiQ (UPF0313 family)
LQKRLYPPAITEELAAIYQHSVRSVVVEGQNLLTHFWKIPGFLRDLSRLREISAQLTEIETALFHEVGRELADRVSREKIDAVGLSVYMGSSTNGSIIIANELRQAHPHLPIILGGPQTTHFAEAIYRETTAPTALVLGEGELSIVELASILDALKAGNLTALSQVPNLVYRETNGQVKQTARQRLAYADWLSSSVVQYEEGDFNGLMRYAFIETSRGCFWQCHFCPQWLLSGKERYQKPAASIVDEMIEINRRFRLTHFELVGSTTSPQQAEEIAQELIARNLQDKFTWVLFMRGRDKNQGETPLPQLMLTLKQAGATAIFFGVEAADDATLRKMGKGESIVDTKAAMIAAREAGLSVIGSFIYPYPGMPANEADLIINFLEETRPLSAPVQALGLFPGTYDAEHAEEIGCEVIYPDRLSRFLSRLGLLPQPNMQTAQVQQYLLRYPLILSLPMRFWSPLPYKIDGLNFQQYVKAVSALQKRIANLGILTGFSHSHTLIAQATGLSPKALAERIFYCNLTGDPQATQSLINLFNLN